MYPTPVTVIGAMNGEKPTWTLVAHVGIIGHDHVLVSLASAHFINGCIKQNKKLTINIVDEEMLPEADKSGSVSGVREDKSELFEYEMGANGAPLVRKSPVVMECSVEDVYNTNGFESFICTIDATYVEESKLNAEGKIDYKTLKPVLFEFPTYEYLRTGDIIGKCLTFKK